MEKQVETDRTANRASSLAWPPGGQAVGRPASAVVAPVFREVLDLVVKLIAPEKIFLAANVRLSEEAPYDLLLVVSGSANRPYSEYEVIMEHIGLQVHPVNAAILRRHELFRKLTTGHIYFSLVCRSENLVYDDGSNPLPVPENIPVDSIINASVRDFQEALDKSQSFLDGARHYASRKKCEMAAFMLHQAMEQVYRGFLKGLTAQPPVSHDLRSLMRRCRRLAPEFDCLFHEHDEGERMLLSLLQKAYVHARYRDDYTMSEDNLRALMDRMNDLYVFAREVFRLKLNAVRKALYQS